MQTIRKIAPIWKYRNRESNKAPYYPYGHTSDGPITPEGFETNYGGFCCNVTVSGSTYYYSNAYEAYASVRSQLDTAIFLSRIRGNIIPDCKTGDSYPSGYRDNWYRKVDNFITYTPSAEPYTILSGLTFILKSEITEDVYGTYVYTGTETSDKLVAIDYIPEYYSVYFEMASGKLYADESAVISSPEITVPILFTEDYVKNGLVRVIEHNLDENGSLVPAPEYPYDGQNGSLEGGCQLESRLSEFISPDTVIDEATNVHRNYRFTGNSYFATIQYLGTYAVSGYTDILPADESVSGDVDTYWLTVTAASSQGKTVIVSNVNNIVGTDDYVIATTLESAISRMKSDEVPIGAECNFNILYSETDVPYREGVIISRTEGDSNTFNADFVDSIDVSSEDSSITITYVFGGEFETSGETYVQGTGIIYTEKFPYNEKIDYITLDGCSHVPVRYMDIDYSANEIEIVNQVTDTTRNAVVTDTVSFPLGNPETFYPVASDDKYAGFSFYPKVTADVDFNRGNATAFERHFKLSECNTLADLENYGNNAYFNI